jgi:hypothetical protein
MRLVVIMAGVASDGGVGGGGEQWLSSRLQG